MDGNVIEAYSKMDEDHLIVINSILSKGRQSFVLAHKMYHMLYDVQGFYLQFSKYYIWLRNIFSFKFI